MRTCILHVILDGKTLHYTILVEQTQVGHLLATYLLQEGVVLIETAMRRHG